MTKREITLILQKAWENLLSDQPNFGSFTSQTNQQELNIAHHYANYVFDLLKQEFSWPMSCDFDVWKSELRKRPDIIFHQRGMHENNLLVLELKVDGSEQDKQREIMRIKEDWFRHLTYKHGAYIAFSRTNVNQMDLLVIDNDTDA